MTTSLSPRSAPVHPTRQQLDELDALLQRMLDLPVNQVDEPGSAEEAEPPIPQYRTPISYKTPVADPPPQPRDPPPQPRLEPRVVPAEEPVAYVPEPTPPPVPPARAEIREPGPDDWVRLASTWQPSAQTWQPLAQSWQQAARPAERSAPMPAPQPALPPEPPAPQMQMMPAPIKAASAEAASFSVPQLAPAVVLAPRVALAEPAPVPAEDSFEDIVSPAKSREPRPAAPTAPMPVAPVGYFWWEWPFVPVNVVFDVVTLALGPLGAGLRSRIGRNLLAVAGIGCLAAATALVVADAIGWIW
jgi:hypothetical protein